MIFLTDTSVHIHRLKTWPESWQAIDAGHKTAEFRLDDRGFEVGHFLELREWYPLVRDGERVHGGRFTGRWMVVRVTHIERGFGIPKGYAMLSFEMPQSEERP